MNDEIKQLFDNAKTKLVFRNTRRFDDIMWQIMSLLTSIQNKIQTRVFDRIGSSATLQTVASSTIDKWGDATPTYNTGVSITYVPYNFIAGRENHLQFGDLKENETDAVLPYTVSFNVKDKITFDGVDYQVEEKESFPFADGNLAFAVRLSKIL